MTDQKAKPSVAAESIPGQAPRAANLLIGFGLVLLLWAVSAALPIPSAPLGRLFLLSLCTVLAATCGLIGTLTGAVTAAALALFDPRARTLLVGAGSSFDGLLNVSIAFGILALAIYADHKPLIMADTVDGAPPPDAASPQPRWRSWLPSQLPYALAGCAVTLCVMACALLAVQLMPGDRPAAGPALLIFAAVLLTATTLGARFGLAAGLLAVIILAATSNFPRGLIDLAIGCALTASAFWAGQVTDRMNDRGALLRATLAASRQIAAAGKDDDVWAALFTGLTQLSPRGSFRLVDAQGQVIRETLIGPLAEPVGGWQEKVLAADGQKVASLQWTRDLARTDRLLIDGAVTILADSAGSSYLRLRLAAEKEAIEFTARTEQVRVLMLDAVSHHFKTPLAGILGSVTSILALPATHKRGSHQTLLLIIKDQANTLNRYIDKYLAVARLESGSIVPRPAPIQLEPMIYDVWESLGGVGGARRFLRVKVEPGPVVADEGLLKQVFSNVLENAIKYSPEESLVEVRSRMVAGEMVVDILDEGAGFPANSAEPIFERFYRAKGAKPAGLGLGLYITRSLLQILGGSVSARNRSDRDGAIFSVVLPRAEAV